MHQRKYPNVTMHYGSYMHTTANVIICGHYVNNMGAVDSGCWELCFQTVKWRLYIQIHAEIRKWIMQRGIEAESSQIMRAETQQITGASYKDDLWALTWWRRTRRCSAQRPTAWSVWPLPHALPSVSSSDFSGCERETTPKHVHIHTNT